jgi:hypothetical protein
MSAPAIGLRPRFAPGPNARIDWEHPLAAGLVFYDWFPNGQPVERAMTKRANGVGVTRFGVGASASGAAGVASSSARADLLPSGGMSHLLVGQWTMASGTYLSLVENTATPASGQVSWYRSTSDIKFYLDSTTGTFVDVVVAASASDVPVVLGLSMTTAGSTIVYRDGGQVTTSAAAGSTFLASNTIGVGASSAGTLGVPGTTNLYAVWNRPLSAAEHASMAADPYQILRY